MTVQRKYVALKTKSGRVGRLAPTSKIRRAMLEQTQQAEIQHASNCRSDKTVQMSAGTIVKVLFCPLALQLRIMMRFSIQAMRTGRSQTSRKRSTSTMQEIRFNKYIFPAYSTVFKYRSLHHLRQKDHQQKYLKQSRKPLSQTLSQ